MAKTSGEVSAQWATDSGASHNFCNDLSLFQSSIPIKMSIGLGDHSTVHASRAGLVVLCTSHGFLQLNSIYVPEFRMSLLSVGQLTFSGWQVNFTYDTCKIIDPQGNLRATAIAKGFNDLFIIQQPVNALVTTRSGGGVDVPSKVSSNSMLDSHVVDTSASVDTSTSTPVDVSADITAVSADSDSAPDTTATIDITTPSVDIPPVQNNANSNTPNQRNQRRLNSLALWHRRFAHLHPVALKKAIKSTGTGNEPSPTFTDESSNFCEICVRSKHQQEFTRTSVPRSTQPFELVHSDLCGPFTTLTLGGASYYIIYIDDCTCWTEVFLLIGKSGAEIRGKFRHYKAWVENQGYRIKRFRCNNGRGEFNNTDFFEILSENGITYEPSPPYTQHKNGTSERMIRTLNTKARSMLQDANLPAKFWGEAIQTACYLHRRTPTATLPGFVSPFEHLYGTTPKIHHLRRFGCAVYKHIPKDQRTDKNLGDCSRICMMLGYVHQTTKIWRIWDFATNRAIEASNTLFNEEVNGNTGKIVTQDELLKLFPEIGNKTLLQVKRKRKRD
jgi:transposase InsO family protein